MEATVLDHPLCHHKLTLLRDVKTPGSLFRKVIEELGLILAVEATRSLPTEPVAVETPLERTQGRRLRSLDPVLVPVLRAGLGLLPSFLELMPTAKVATSDYTATTTPWCRCPTTGTSRRSWRSAACSCWTPCSPPAAAPRRRCAS